MITEEWQAKSRLCKRKSWVTQDGNVKGHCDCCSDHRCKWENETAFPKREVQPHCHCSGDGSHHKNEWQNDTAFPKIEVQPHCESLFWWRVLSQEQVTEFPKRNVQPHVIMWQWFLLRSIKCYKFTILLLTIMIWSCECVTSLFTGCYPTTDDSIDRAH